VLAHAKREGYAATVEALLRLAVERTDRPKRDCAIVMHADFAHDAGALPDLVRRIESGADLVVAEGSLAGEPSRSRRLLRRWAPLLLRGRIHIPGVYDLVSGFAAFRLVTLRNALRAEPGRLLRTDGWAANAELLARTARHARRIESVTVTERHDLRHRQSRVDPWLAARDLWRARAHLDVPPLPPAQPAQAPEAAAV
jgi:hypothetical protein